MDTYQKSPENIPSSRFLEEGFLSHLRQKMSSKILAIVIVASSPIVASASINPNSGSERDFLETLIIPQTPPEGETGSGDEYMTDKEMQAEYCNDTDPMTRVYFCYLSRINMEIDGHEHYDGMLQDFQETGGNPQDIVDALQQAETIEGFTEEDISLIITFVTDTYYFSQQQQQGGEGEDHDYYIHAYLPLKEQLLKRFSYLERFVPAVENVGVIEK